MAPANSRRSRCFHPILVRSLFTISEVAKSFGFTCNSKAALSMQQVRLSATRNPVQMNAVVLFGADNRLLVNGVAIQHRFLFQDGDLLRFYAVKPSQEAAKLQLSASFHVKNGETLDFLLPVPQVLGIKEELLRNGSTTNKPLFLSTSTLPYSVFPTAHYSKESKKFSGLFAFVQTQDYSRSSDLRNQIEQRLQNLFLITPATLEIVTDRGSFRPNYGDHFALGQSDKMIFSIHKVDFPWVLLQTLLILWIAKMLFQPPFFAAIENVGLQLLVITADFFLMTRFLFSFRASNLYPFSSESLTLSLFAILIVPYLIFSGALLIRNTWGRRQTFNFISYSAIVCILAATVIRSFAWLTFIIAGIFSILALLRFHPRSFVPQTIRQSAGSEVPFAARSFHLLNVPVEVYLGLFVLAAFLSASTRNR